VAIAVDLDPAWTTNSGTSATTSAAFSPQANSLIVISASCDSGTGTITCTFTDSVGLSWTPIGTVQTGTSGGSAAAAWAFTASAQVGMTVTATWSGSGVTSDKGVKPTTLTGTLTAAAIGAASQNNSTTNNLTVSYTNTADGSRGMAVGTEWNALGLPTSTDTEQGYHTANVDGISVYKAANTSGTSQTVNINLDAGGSGAALWSYKVFEVLPAAGGAAEANYAGPWTRPTPGGIGPTGHLQPGPLGDATTPLNVYAPDEAAGTGTGHDATVDLAPTAETTTGTGAAHDAAPDVAVNAETTTATGTAYDATVAVDSGNTAGPWTGPTPGRVGPTGQWRIVVGDATTPLVVYLPAEATAAGAAFDAIVDVTSAAETTTAAGAALDATADLTVNAEAATATGTAHDATVATETDQLYAGPWTAVTPGWISPTGQLAALFGDTSATQDLQVAVPAEASATGAAFDAEVALGPTAETTAATGTAHDATAAIEATAETSTAAGLAQDPSVDASATAETTTATGTAHDAAIDTAQATAGPWTGPTPGRLSPTGRWTPGPTDTTPPAITPAAEATNAVGTAYDATIAIGPAAEPATATAEATAPTISAEVVADLASATGAAPDAVFALAAAVEAALATGVAYTATTTAALFDTNATSSAAVTAGVTSTAAVTARRTSTSTVSDG
jgi:hypothetical protein